MQLARQGIPDNNYYRSLLPFLRNQTTLQEQNPRRDAVYYEYPSQIRCLVPHEAIRTSEWKYIRIDNNDTPYMLYFEELYNLIDTPHETQYLAFTNQRKTTINDQWAKMRVIKHNIVYTRQV